MSDIFLSYKSEDRNRAKIIAEMLEQKGYSVWWDRKIPLGKTFDQVIEEQLDAAKCVMVLWSQQSVLSDWVKEEANEGLQRRILVPILIDDVRIPLGFRRIQAARLVDWQGKLPDSEFDKILESVSEILGNHIAAEKEKSEVQEEAEGEAGELYKVNSVEEVERQPAQNIKIINPSKSMATQTISKKHSASKWCDKGLALMNQRSRVSWEVFVKKLKEAIEAFDKALEIDPKNKDAWNKKGYALEWLSRYQEALEAYDKALEVDPQFIEAWDHKAFILEELRRYEEAAEVYDKVLEIDPRHEYHLSYNASAKKGNLFFGLRRYRKAIEAYDKALEIDPENHYIWYDKALALKRLRRYEEAIEAFDKVLEINPNHLGAIKDKGSALDKLGRLQKP